MDRVDLVKSTIIDVNGPFADLVKSLANYGPNTIIRAKFQSIWKRSIKNIVKNNVTLGASENITIKNR